MSGGLVAALSIVAALEALGAGDLRDPLEVRINRLVLASCCTVLALLIAAVG